MTLPTRTTEPSAITKGERIEWTKSYDDFSAEDYTLEYRFRGTGTGFNVSATADGAAFVAAITAAQSTTMTPGRYEWQPWLTEIGVATNTFLAPGGGGRINVKAGFVTGTTTTTETRSVARQIVDAIDAAFLASETSLSDVIEYEISTPAGSRRVKRSREEALKLRDKYAKIADAEDRKERTRKGGSFGTQIGVRFFDE